jgi:hypothetical protein
MSNSEIVKWIEIWLDSAGERVYQPALVSALASREYLVLHNTSHNSLELGKDIICRSPTGELLALQLKGNPNSRLTMSQWHALSNQIFQLVTTPVAEAISQKKSEAHRPILVTNGEIEEDVRAAVSIFNEGIRANYPHSRPLELWSRGMLVEMLSQVAASIWPTDLSTQILLLKAITVEPKNSILENDVQEIVVSVLRWKDKPSTQLCLARISGLGTVLAIFVSRYISIGNFFEAIKCKGIAVGILAGYISKHRVDNRRVRQLYKLLREDLFDLIAAFAEGIALRFENRPFLNRNILDEFGIYHTRKILVCSLVAVHMHEMNAAVSDAVRKLVLRDINYPFLVGERLVPAFLALFWAKDRFTGTISSDRELVSLLYAIINSAEMGVLLSSYYSIEEMALWRYKLYLGREWHEIDRDNRTRVSQFANSIFAMLALRNWKQTCKLLWPSLTKMVRQQKRISVAYEFAFPNVEDATQVESIPKIPETWDSLLEKFAEPPKPEIPPLIKDDTSLLLLLIILLPYRATDDIVRFLDKNFGVLWYK